jgi:hypothetical protein
MHRIAALWIAVASALHVVALARLASNHNQNRLRG